MFIEGNGYKIVLDPAGQGVGKDTHIAVFLYKFTCEVLCLEKPFYVDHEYELLHPSDIEKNHKHIEQYSFGYWKKNFQSGYGEK